MAKVKDLRLGQTLWMAYDRHGYICNITEPVEVFVTGLSVRSNDGRKDIYTFTCSHNTGTYNHYSESELKLFFYFTKEKAQHFIDSEGAKVMASRVRHELRQRIRERNILLLKELEPLLGKRIMIRVEEGEWIVSSIKTIVPTYKEGVLQFIDTARSNRYKFNREGRNWKYWTELDELKAKRDALEKQIAELEGSR